MDMNKVSIYVEFLNSFGKPQSRTYNNVLCHFIGEAGELLIEYYITKEDKNTTRTVFATGRWLAYKLTYVNE